MRYTKLIILSILFCSQTVSATWQKISSADYIWGPFKIYTISLFSETGKYVPELRPLMLTLQYEKPVDGRDFAISLARSWSSLGITLPEQDKVVDRLRKILPDIKKDDSLSYIALPDRGYFVLNDIVIPEEFNKDFNDAVLAVWLDPRVEIGRKLLAVKPDQTAEEKHSPAITPQNADNNSATTEIDISQAPIIDGVLEQLKPKTENQSKSENNQPEAPQQAVSSEQHIAKTANSAEPPKTEAVERKATVEESKAENNANAPAQPAEETPPQPKPVEVKKTEPQKPVEKPMENEQSEPEIEIRPPADPLPEVTRPVS